MIWVSRSALLLSWLLAIVLTISSPARCQTQTVLDNFDNGTDGGSPNWCLTADRSGNLYGTTSSGGHNYGVVFQLSPNGNGGWTGTVVQCVTSGKGGTSSCGLD